MEAVSIVVAFLAIAASWALAHWQLLFALAFALILFNALSMISGQIAAVCQALVALNSSLGSIDERLENASDEKRLSEIGAKTTDDIVNAWRTSARNLKR